MRVQGTVSSDVGRRLEEKDGVLCVPGQACIDKSSASAPLATTIAALPGLPFSFL